MAIDPEVQKLIDAAGLSSEDRAKALEAFNIEGLGKVVRDGVLMRADYSRKMDELRVKTETVEANWKKANDEYIRMQQDLEATVAEKEEAARKLAEAETKLRDSAAQPVTPPTPPIDPAKFLSVEAFEAEKKRIAAGQLAMSLDVLEAADRVQAITGTRISPKKLAIDAIAAGKDPAAYAEETYGLSAKEAEAAAAARKKELDDAREEGYRRAIAEAANPATRPLDASKDPFYVPKPEGGTAVQPWDMTDRPADEVAFEAELTRSVAGG